MNLEELLRTQVECEDGRGNTVQISPEFRVSVQGERDGGLHFIIHAHGYDSETLDFVVKGNELTQI